MQQVVVSVHRNVLNAAEARGVGERLAMAERVKKSVDFGLGG